MIQVNGGRQPYLYVSILILFFAGVSSCRSKSKATRLAMVNGLMKNIASNLVEYQSTHGHLPPATLRDKEGKPLHSWRLLILLCGQQRHKVNISKTWDDPNNLKNALSLNGHYTMSKSVKLTSVLAITGPDTAFMDGKKTSLKDLPNDLILMIGVRNPEHYWMKPYDLSVERFDEIRRSLPSDKIGTIILFSDLHVWILKSDVPATALRKFFTISGANKHDRARILGPYLKYGSAADRETVEKVFAK